MSGSASSSTSAKPIVMFIHGFLDGADAWNDVVDALRSDVDARAVDLAGMGARADETGPFTLERFALDVGLSLESIGQPVVLVGHSMGAQVAEIVAARHPSRVRGLVQLTPVALGGTPLPEEAQASFRALGGQPAAQRELRQRMSVSLSANGLERLGALGDRPAPAAVRAFFDAWRQGHPDGAHPTRYPGPVLIVSGEGDPFVDAAMIASAIAPRFGKATRATIPQAGHWPHIEQPAVLARVIGDFVRTLDDAAVAPVAQQGWKAAFANRSAQAFSDAFAPDMVLDATVLTRPLVGRDAVKTVMGTASNIYESVTFTHEATNGARTYLEWTAAAFGGFELRGITILTKDDDGRIVRAAIHHRPLGAALRFSAELGKRLDGKIPPDYFHAAA
jgi:pimeloyl-ACP methyl ester carboxylesterase